MITKAPTKRQLDEWRQLWLDSRDSIKPDRKTGQQLIDYLEALYELEEIFDPAALEIISGNITGNPHSAAKLPEGTAPAPRAFYVRDSSGGSRLYLRRSRREAESPRIFVGVDTVSGCYHVEGSEWLWDELCAYQGLDDADLGNYVCTAMYILCKEQRRRIIGSTVTVTVDRPMGSAHPRHPDMIYPVNYGYVKGIIAPDHSEQDAYILGVNRPVPHMRGTIIAVIHRRDDVEDKWVVVPEGTALTCEQIRNQTSFQEKYFDSEVIV